MWVRVKVKNFAKRTPLNWTSSRLGTRCLGRDRDIRIETGQLFGYAELSWARELYRWASRISPPHSTTLHLGAKWPVSIPPLAQLGSSTNMLSSTLFAWFKWNESFLFLLSSAYKHKNRFWMPSNRCCCLKLQNNCIVTFQERTIDRSNQQTRSLASLINK